ncbi:unnamed protein product, partial [Ectocarpus sp. 4 AP-2014]
PATSRAAASTHSPAPPPPMPISAPAAGFRSCCGRAARNLAPATKFSSSSRCRRLLPGEGSPPTPLAASLRNKSAVVADVLAKETLATASSLSSSPPPFIPENDLHEGRARRRSRAHAPPLPPPPPPPLALMLLSPLLSPSSCSPRSRDRQ